MTKKELEAALVLRRRLTRLENSLADIRATGGIKSSSGNSTRAGAGIGPGQIAAELEDEIAELRKKYEIEREIIRRSLEKVEFEELERKLMVMRYVDCMPWKNIQIIISYQKTQAYDLHRRALSKILV